jgi:uncharacterized protein (TIGR03435 family)
MKTAATYLVLPLWLVVLTASRAQSPTMATARPAFEVASIKLRRATPGPLSVSTGVGPAGIDYKNVTLMTCIRAAYGFQRYRILGGDDWLNSERYDILARAASAAPKTGLMLMLQMMLEDRFKLKVHRETKEIPIYALVVGKNGLKLRPGKEDGETEIGGAGHLINSRGMTMKALAGALTQITQRSGRPIQDMTGIEGVYDITLDFVSSDVADADNGPGPDIFSALQEAGLKLEPRKSSLEVLVIDHAQRPSEN